MATMTSSLSVRAEPHLPYVIPTPTLTFTLSLPLPLTLSLPLAYPYKAHGTSCGTTSDGKTRLTSGTARASTRSNFFARQSLKARLSTTTGAGCFARWAVSRRRGPSSPSRTGSGPCGLVRPGACPPCCTGYAYHSPACCTYQRRRAACPLGASLYCTHAVHAYQPRACRTCRVLWHHRWRYSRNAWPECSMRFMGRVECEHLLCDWCGRGCSCYSANCSVSRLGGANVCHNSTGRTWAKGAAQHVVGKQLFADSDVATFR